MCVTLYGIVVSSVCRVRVESPAREESWDQLVLL